MIRDGITTDIKRIRRIPKKVDDVYETDYLESVVRAYDLFESLGSVEGAAYLRDPYAMILFLEPIGVKLPENDENVPEDGVLTCQEYYEAVINDKIDEILPKLTVRERIFCNLAAEGKIKIPKDQAIHEICRKNGIDVRVAMDTWILQPDVEAISFALGSERAVLEGVTPALGIPLKTAYPSYTTSNIRFPAVVEKNPFRNKLVQVHRDAELFIVFDDEGKETVLDPKVKVALQNIASSYVVEGFINNFGQLIVWDLLCWNDVWLHRRPLTERVKMLWRFHEWNQERFVVRNWKELQQFEDDYVLRNTNSPYNPASSTSHIFLTNETQTAVLVVGGAKGKKTPCLVTIDKKPLF
jgi:hypothetical protein